MHSSERHTSCAGMSKILIMESRNGLKCHSQLDDEKSYLLSRADILSDPETIS